MNGYIEFFLRLLVKIKRNVTESDSCVAAQCYVSLVIRDCYLIDSIIRLLVWIVSCVASYSSSSVV